MEEAIPWEAVWNRLPDPSRFTIAIYFALGFGFIRYLLENIIYKPFACLLLNCGNAKSKKDDATQSKFTKCTESMWKLTYYGTMQAWVISIIKQESWSLNTNQYFQGWPDQEISNSLLHFYMCEGGFYVFSIVALLIWETRRKDFAIMMAHHIITSTLIGVSFFLGLFRIGTIILALHDTSDVFLEAAKIFKYAKLELLASIFFGLFAISWLILRMIFFPFWIIEATSYQTIQEFRKMDPFPTFYYYLFNTMLLMLLIFHIYWWKLICAMIVRQLSNKGKVTEDIRSDSDDD